jgi:glycosyltransferase involved in cell wall biosynthesis
MSAQEGADPASAPAGAQNNPAPGAPRIVYHLNGWDLGGMEHHALALGRGVARAGWQVAVLLLDLPVLDPLIAGFGAAGVTTHRLPVRGEQSAARRIVAAWRTRGLLRQMAPAILHQHRAMGREGRWTVFAARAARVPIVVVTEHFTAYRTTGPRRQVNAAVDRLVDRIVVVSEHDYRAQLSETGRPAAKIVCVHNGIDVTRYQPAPLEAVAARRTELGIPADVPVIGTVARLEEVKGVSYFLRALPALAQRWPGLVVLIAGEGTIRQALEAEAAALGVAGYTRFVGRVSDVPVVMSLMDVVVMPSIEEPFGLVAAEAMSVGRPLIASRTGGLPEIVEDGDSGLLVPPADPVALAQAVDRLLADPVLRDRLAAAGQRRVAAQFTQEVMTNKTLALYRELLAGKRLS